MLPRSALPTRVPIRSGEMKLQRAVIIAPILPAETGNGLAMRMGMFAEAIRRFATLDLVLVPVAGGPISPSPYLGRLGVNLHVVPVAGRGETHFQFLSRLTDAGKRLAAFKAYGKPSLTSYLSAPVLDEIRRIVAACKPDLVHIGRSYLAPCLSVLPDRIACTLDLDEDDLTSFLSQAHTARRDGDIHKAEWLEQEGRACDSLIRRLAPSFKLIFVASDREAILLRQRHAHLHPILAENGVGIPRYNQRLDDGETLLFAGALSYAPNAEGITWFARTVLPRLRSRNGAPCRVLIAGAQPPGAIRAVHCRSRIHFLGHVPDLGALYRRSALALAPLHAGGGTRIKLLEAASYGVASVSTSLASQGIGWPEGLSGWTADSAGEFASACHEALSHAPERQLRGTRSRSWVRRHHNRALLSARIARIVQQSLIKTEF